MKRIFFVLTAWLLLAACSDNGDEATEREESGIRFSPTVTEASEAALAPATRTAAGVLTTDLLNADGGTMGVFGYSDSPNQTVDDKTDTSLGFTVFDNQEVDFATATRWEYSPVKYWDKTAGYSFFAYAPHSSEATAITAVNVGKSTEAPYTEQLTIRAAPSQYDLLVADRVIRTAGENDVVMLRFHHIMSYLRIFFAVDDTINRLRNFEVVSLSVGGDGLYGSGKYTYDADEEANTGWSETVAAMTGHTWLDEMQTAVVPAVEPDKTLIGNTQFVIPTDACLTLYFKLKVYDKHDTYITTLDKQLLLAHDVAGVLTPISFVQGEGHTILITIDPLLLGMLTDNDQPNPSWQEIDEIATP